MGHMTFAMVKNDTMFCYTQSKCAWIWWILCKIPHNFVNFSWNPIENIALNQSFNAIHSKIAFESCLVMRCWLMTLLSVVFRPMLNQRFSFDSCEFFCVLHFIFLHLALKHFNKLFGKLSILYAGSKHTQTIIHHKIQFFRWNKANDEKKNCRQFSCLILITSFSFIIHPCRNNGTSIQTETRTI